jgi:predicted DNA-binding transcriptional regulator YafY
MPHHNIRRRVQLYKLLRTGRSFSINELAKILGVGERIIHRDLAVLQRGSEEIEIIEASDQGPVSFDTTVLEPRGIRC